VSTARRLTAGPVAAVLLLAGCTGAPDGAGTPPPEDDVAAADTDLVACPEQPDEAAAPSDLPALQLDCFSGGTVDLGRAPGVPTVVNLWASWCAPCREELPVVQQLADTAGDRVRVLGVVSKDGVPQATSFAADAGATFPTAFDADGELMDGLGIRALPYTYFLAADGSVAHVEVGPVESLEELQQLVGEHLGVQL
jgi:cytochrome c biogenesis protein CcmG/thiol:disulfide interchange protein DsbE